MQTTTVKIDNITYEYGDECGEGQDFCIWQIAPDGSGRKRKEICSKHFDQLNLHPELTLGELPPGVLTREQENQILEGYRTQHEGCCDHDEPH